MKRILLSCVAFLAMLPATGSAARIFVGVGGPVIGPYGWYAPYGYYPYGAVVGVPPAGEVKFDTKVKTAQVFINGAFAGTVGDLKTLHMRPGTYNFELRTAEGGSFQETVYVLAGKTTKLQPNFVS